MLIRRVPALPVWGAALRELDAASRGMQRFLDSMSDVPGLRTAGVFPAVNLTERPEALCLRAELPGFPSDRIQITVENNTVTLSGERALDVESDDASYHRREREWGTFRRSVTLPVRIDAEHVRATHRDGVLTVELPKAVEARPRQIDVQIGD